MKKIVLALITITTFLFSSCDKESSSTTLDDSELNYNGQWNLVKVQGGIAGFDFSFSPGLITWDLNPITHIVTVVNNNTNPDMVDVLETGTYNYQISTEPNDFGCDETFLFDENVNMGCIYIEDGKLIMNQTYADGMRLEFER